MAVGLYANEFNNFNLRYHSSFFLEHTVRYKSMFMVHYILNKPVSAAINFTNNLKSICFFAIYFVWLNFVHIRHKTIV